MTMPLVSRAQCIALDPDNGGIKVLLTNSGQGPATSVKMLYYGPADALRIRQTPLPTPGTWGIVVFPSGDVRNGIWVGSYLPSGVDALTATTSGVGPTPVTDGYLDYESTFSGWWKLRDSAGQTALRYPDGTYFTVAAASGLPEVFRHTMQRQTRVRSAFPDDTSKISSVPDAFFSQFMHPTGTTFGVSGSGDFFLTVSGTSYTGTVSGDMAWHASGTLIALTASGNYSITASGTVMNITPGGDLTVTASGSVMEMTPAGNFSVTASGTTLNVNRNGNLVAAAGTTSITIAKNGNITLNMGGSSTLNITQGGGSASDSLALVSKLVSAFNGHIHTAPSGGGPTSAPTSSWSSSTVKSSTVNVNG